MTRMKLGPNIPDHFFFRADVNPSVGHLAGTPVNDLAPLRLGVRVHGAIQAGDELAGQICAILFRQGQHFGHFFSSNAHATKILGKRPVPTSLFVRLATRPLGP